MKTDNYLFFEYLELIKSKLQDTNWSKQDLKDYLSSKYSKHSLYALTDKELREVSNHLLKLSQKHKLIVPRIGIKVYRARKINVGKYLHII